MASSSAVGRRRGMVNQLSTEDQALNEIAREAEARLAAKRAARAEARSIRMNELEKMQKEADHHMDKEYEKDFEDSPKKRVVSRLTSGSKKNDIIESQFGLDTQATQFKELYKEAEEKYRKAMVSIAQLDNEKQALLYQVDCLKDNVEDFEEALENITDELSHKIKDYNKLYKEHADLQKQFSKLSDLLKDRERILDEHGINIDGTLKEETLDKTDQVNESSKLGSNHIENTDELHSEIERLQREVKLLKLEQDKCYVVNTTQKEADTIRLERTELERSFVDVSDEASAIQEERRHAGIFINNNEKCDEFEVIDTGSQQGGLHHFEDKSFELSVQSLMLSEDTEIASEYESDLPLELSVEKNNNKHDYEIIVNEIYNTPNKLNLLDIDHMIENERSPTPDVKSNIVVDKYLYFEDNELKNEEPKLNIDQYFSTVDQCNSIIADNEANIIDRVVEEESYDTIENKDFNLNHVVEARQSPYVELENEALRYAELPFNDATSNDQNADNTETLTNSELFTNNDNLELINNLENHFNLTPSELDTNLNNLNSLNSIPNKDYDSNVDVLPDNANVLDKFDMSNKDCKIQDPFDAIETEVNKTLYQVTLDVHKLDDILPNENNESILVTKQDIIEGEKPFCYNEEVSNEKNTFISQEVIDLYETSAGDASCQPKADHNMLSNIEAGSSNDVTQTICEENIGDEMKRKGCIVRVESFSQATPQSAELKEVKEVFDFKNEQINLAHNSKDKKSKKKKNKSKSNESKLENHNPECPATLGLFVPEISLLGYSDSRIDQHRHSDIPQQFLEVSHGLGSVSDVSDTEESDIPKRSSTKKQNKKDACKSQ
ncbi:uncharacterized protein PF3D7_1120600 isoform X1 [Hydra vulgaris]|uniref:uncharacterized protein PF3D7_1120600 isoform X1 n=1 Tax=Hydra vulgaris TaxID=6087 RepID=UPI001F5ED530|nr:uncharacterized protein PF3D7_1120600 [Hydra vulgaris]